MIDTTNTEIYLLYADGILKKRWYSYHNHCYTVVEISNIHENEMKTSTRKKEGLCFFITSFIIV